LGLDVTLDGIILTANIDTQLNVNYKFISDLTGIEEFIALTELECKNNSLGNLNVTQNILLTKLICGGNSISNIDVTQNTALTFLECRNQSLDITDTLNKRAN